VRIISICISIKLIAPKYAIISVGKGRCPWRIRVSRRWGFNSSQNRNKAGNSCFISFL